MLRISQFPIISISVVACFYIVMIRAEISNSEGSNNNLGHFNSTGNMIVDEGSGETSITNYNDILMTNVALQRRVETLENRLEAIEALLISLNSDAQFYHPTSEIQYVDMEVVHWGEAVKRGLRNVAIEFQAGFTTGAISSWEFSLAIENDAVTVNLLLIEERYNRRAIFAGFTAYVLNSDGNVYSQANALPVNFLDGNGRTLHLPGVVSLNEIRNSNNSLISNDVFTMRFRLELLGVGHKLYSEAPLLPQVPTKDAQKVIFDVTNLFQKLEERKQSKNSTIASSVSENERQPLAYTKFALMHDAWYMETDWSAEIFDGENAESVSLHVILERCDWSKLYASFYLEIWDAQTQKLIHKQATPVNDFMKEKITIDPLLFVSPLKEEYDEMPRILQFKLQFVIYGKNARYYTDVI